MSRSGEAILDELFDYAISNGLIDEKFREGRLGILFSVIAAELERWEEIIEDYEEQLMLYTATDDSSIFNLSYPLYRRAMARPSYVLLRISRVAGVTGDITIPAQTVVQTGGFNPIEYRTMEEVTLYEYDNEVEVLARSVDLGANTMVGENALIVFSPQIHGVEVTNPYPSWGGRDAETAFEVKERALNVRYELMGENYYSLIKSIEDVGLPQYKFNVKDNAYGYGTFAVYIDTDDPYLFDDVKNEVNIVKPLGVYAKVDKATPLHVNFDVAVDVYENQNLTPRRRRQLRNQIISLMNDYIKRNGVGRKLSNNQMTNYLLNALLPEYEVSDIEITSPSHPNKQTEHGDFILEPFEVIRVQNILISIREV